jgi:hypothetical protein
MASGKSFNINLFSGLLGLLLTSVNSLGHAGAAEDMATIKSKLESRTPPIKSKSIKPSPIAGLYEVFIQGMITRIRDFLNLGGNLRSTNTNITCILFRQERCGDTNFSPQSSKYRSAGEEWFMEQI